MAIATALFLLVNVAYFCAVRKDLVGTGQAPDMAMLFFQQVFNDEIAPRVMAGLIAFSIFGNIVVMTFTAARVKQEIAKEGILPWSLIFATGHTTPWACPPIFDPSRPAAEREEERQLEQTPMAALVLHWFSSVVLIGVTSMLEPAVAYSALVSIYSYSIIILNGFFVSGGLLLLKLTPSRNWKIGISPSGEKTGDANIKFWLDPLHAVIYCLTCAFLLVAAFLRPADGSPYSYAVSGIQWYIVPAIGLSTLLWGVVWWGGLNFAMYWKQMDLVVSRRALTVQDRRDADQYIQKGEIVSHDWETRAGRRAEHELAPIAVP